MAITFQHKRRVVRHGRDERQECLLGKLRGRSPDTAGPLYLPTFRRDIDLAFNLLWTRLYAFDTALDAYLPLGESVPHDRAEVVDRHSPKTYKYRVNLLSVPNRSCLLLPSSSLNFFHPRLLRKPELISNTFFYFYTPFVAFFSLPWFTFPLHNFCQTFSARPSMTGA